MSGCYPQITRRAGAQIRGQMVEALVLEILIEPPTLDLLHDLVELRTRDRPVDEPFAAAESAEIPRMVVFEFRRHRELPQRQVFFEIGVERLLGAIERA